MNCRRRVYADAKRLNSVEVHDTSFDKSQNWILDRSDQRRFCEGALEYFGRLIALAADDDMRTHEQRRIE
jgi:hypothetical protein